MRSFITLVLLSVSATAGVLAQELPWTPPPTASLPVDDFDVPSAPSTPSLRFTPFVDSGFVRSAIESTDSTPADDQLEERAFLSDTSSVSSLYVKRGFNINSIRCRTDQTCASRARGVPKNSHAVCNRSAKRCRFVCKSGYVPTKGVCTKPKPTPTRKPKPTPKGLCGKKECPPHPDNGFFHCIQGKTCLLSCSAGWQPKSNSVCVNIHNDAESCGSAGRRCPASYNGVGKPICTAGRCSLSCPRGSSIKKRGSSLYCTTRAV